MKIGILSESSDDSIILRELVSRVLAERASPVPREELLFLPPLEARTSILPKMEVATVIFFDGLDVADALVFGVDLDGDNSRRRKVRAFVQSEQEKNPNRIIVPLFVEPHIESIFFGEKGNCLKAVLTRLNPADPIPYDDMEPKSRIARLIGEFGPLDVTFTRKEIYRDLTTKLDLDLLTRTRSGNNFRDFRYKLLGL